jgi:HAD superfamily phosphatase (TIGR01668 family)
MIFDRKAKAMPDYYFRHLLDITPDDIKNMGAEAIAVDLDNTAVFFGSFKLEEGVREWTANMLRSGIKVIIVSNTLNSRAFILSKQMCNVGFIALSLKPSPRGIENASRRLGVPVEKIAMIGDKLSSDILAANRAGAIAVKVENLRHVYERESDLPKYAATAATVAAAVAVISVLK